jgi:peptide deformylase
MKILTVRDNLDTLRKVSALVSESDFKDKNFQNECNTIKNYFVGRDNIVGLAAIQLGIQRQIIAIRLQPVDGFRKSKMVLVMVNPVVVYFSNETTPGHETCLSEPGVVKFVRRSQVVTVNYFDQYGIPHRRTFAFFEARAVQHEIDHLKGILLRDIKDEPIGGKNE